MALLDLLQGVEAAIIVDAVAGDGFGGVVRELDLADLESFSSGSKSAHGWGVAETLRLGRMLIPELQDTEMCLIGIETAGYALGDGLSPSVRAALPLASGVIQRRVDRALRR